ncbi:hypothetical protein A3K29_01540 [Candidatus Collierbacteria bacterium RIFOXYB2_FULL_46_14]|uniref:Uncharacterized protein n=1 Tax=Candidatus Collierbacteria bacterium GW2011_GWA2_46_26 TaxID=1618381 RepID=A0A0G1PJ47_9BACT|nr:MAG: hypothetical protein UW29_C0006G0048 [Candidatus Collierbacteria bacterium GW2011_GWC2_44_13]KKU32834.1 MAG: hypothetical protein UX47_C0007G0078 [Candidatus Collierbacteria bacterium GW2011_GWA2_46_26]OGD72813.1 MAG: hypothetical protein A3K29_01540 [Candidatus Collierbacteria bacterium RIFOXYB2_FULL_46_14]OGD75855.1 MAG: hypothetical protein A3K43_01540 [Candidatus Collierbacteria bacterium RIFOXYA2_FULL_46_20]OGD77191.1 MAG: hypothetical protein A3K39_01540 [Candidatus Collierbacteri
MTLPQIVSLISTVLLTSVALVIGIQMIFILKELRYSLTKLNQTIDTVSDTVEKIAQPALGLFAILEGFKESGKIIETVSRFFAKEKNKTEGEEIYDNTI